MKRLALALLAVTAGLQMSSAHAQALGGLRRLKGSKIELRFQPCAGGVCGVIETSARIQADPDARDDKNKDERLRARKLKGLTMLDDLRPVGASWKGRVYWFPSGSTYDVTLKPAGADTLNATACLAPLLCQTYTLTHKP